MAALTARCAAAHAGECANAALPAAHQQSGSSCRSNRASHNWSVNRVRCESAVALCATASAWMNGANQIQIGSEWLFSVETTNTRSSKPRRIVRTAAQNSTDPTGAPELISAITSYPLLVLLAFPKLSCAASVAPPACSMPLGDRPVPCQQWRREPFGLWISSSLDLSACLVTSAAFTFVGPFMRLLSAIELLTALRTSRGVKPQPVPAGVAPRPQPAAALLAVRHLVTLLRDQPLVGQPLADSPVDERIQTRHRRNFDVAVVQPEAELINVGWRWVRQCHQRRTRAAKRIYVPSESDSPSKERASFMHATLFS